LLAVLLRHKLLRRFTWFFTFLVANVTVSIGVLGFRNMPRQYFILYWYGDALVTLFVLMAIYEVFRIVFQRFYKLKWFRWLFPSVIVGLMAISSLRAILHSQSTENFLNTQILSLEIAAGIVQVGLFFLFLILAQFFHLAWKEYTFGIALGFGVSAAGDLVAFIIRSEFGTKFDTVFRFAVPLAYTVGAAIWLFTFLWPVPNSSLEVATPALTPEAVVRELKQYTRTVKEILKR
jgi:hypothetical protein